MRKDTIEQCYFVVDVAVHVSVCEYCASASRKENCRRARAPLVAVASKKAIIFDVNAHTPSLVSSQWISRDKYALRSAECLPLAATFLLRSSMSSYMREARRWARVHYAQIVSDFIDCRLSNASLELFENTIASPPRPNANHEILNKQNRQLFHTRTLSAQANSSSRRRNELRWNTFRWNS